MILFVNNNIGFLFLTHEQIITPPEVIPSHGPGGITAEMADVRLEDMRFKQIMREDEEIILLASHIIMKHGTFGLS